MIITIDGPAGTGKTTIAKMVAEELGFTYFDTGAMYRALTYGVIEYKVNIEDKDALVAFLQAHPITVKSYLGEKRYFLGSEDVTTKIRSQEVTRLVSQVAALAHVREVLVKVQRELASGVNLVVEGRDMGTVVFPDATVKVFLTADLQVRAMRRYKEIIAKNPESSITLETVMEDIDRRDKYDASRDVSPMRPADDAVIIDTSDLNPDQVVNRIIVLKEQAETRPLTNS